MELKTFKPKHTNAIGHGILVFAYVITALIMRNPFLLFIPVGLSINRRFEENSSFFPYNHILSGSITLAALSYTYFYSLTYASCIMVGGLIVCILNHVILHLKTKNVITVFLLPTLPIFIGVVLHAILSYFYSVSI